MTTGVSVIDRSVQQAHVWINEVAEEMHTEDKRFAYQSLRAFLHALRDRITVDEAAQFAAQLPELIRGVFYQGWNPSKTPESYHDRSSFLRRMVEAGPLDGLTEASYAAEVVPVVLRHRISAGELDDVIAILPSEVADLFDEGRPKTQR